MQQDTPATLYPDYAQTERGQELKGFLHWTLPQGYWTWVPIQVDPNRCTVLKGVRESSLGESKDCALKSRDKMEPSGTGSLFGPKFGSPTSWGLTLTQGVQSHLDATTSRVAVSSASGSFGDWWLEG